MPTVNHGAREQWLLARREFITASDVAAIIGEDERRGALAVYAAKVGEVELEETRPMRRGRRFEEAIAQEYADQTGRPVANLGEFELTRHPSIPWLAATLDRITDGTAVMPGPSGECPERNGDRHVPLQIKMAIGSAREWKDEPPLGYVVQVQTEIACYGGEWGALAGLVGPGPLATFDLVRDRAFFDALVPVLDRFRWHVLHRIPPEADGRPGTSAAIRRLWANEDGATVALDAEALRLTEAWEQARMREAAAAEAAMGLENQLRRRLGSASFGALNDGSFLTLRTTRRRGYAVEPTEYRMLRRFRPRIRRRA